MSTEKSNSKPSQKDSSPSKGSSSGNPDAVDPKLIGKTVRDKDAASKRIPVQDHSKTKSDGR
jgi:hypothetical protein